MNAVNALLVITLVAVLATTLHRAALNVNDYQIHGASEHAKY